MLFEIFVKYCFSEWSLNRLGLDANLVHQDKYFQHLSGNQTVPHLFFFSSLLFCPALGTYRQLTSAYGLLLQTA